MLVLYVQGGHRNDGDSKVENVKRDKAGHPAEGKMQLSCGCSSQPLMPMDKSGRRNADRRDPV